MSVIAKTFELPLWARIQGLSDAIGESTQSKDPDRMDRVGCVIYEMSNEESMKYRGYGYNHTLDGSNVRGPDGKAVPHVVHAETAALANLAYTHSSYTNDRPYLVAFSTKEPCLNCLVQLAAHGIRQIHFIQEIPRHKSGRHLLQHFPMIEEYRQHELSS